MPAEQPYNLVALLPMKAHSARIEGKNFRPFANKPLFRWILDTLLSIETIERIVINTDVRGVLADYGLSDGDRILIRDRRPELCGDLISMNNVLADDIANVNANVYLMTHTTNPLLRAGSIRKALDKYHQATQLGEADSLFTVNKYQSRFYRADGSPINHDPDNLVRTQDLEPYYEENSNLYIFSRAGFQKRGARVGVKPVLFETPRLESFDIDDQAGWNLAEIIALYQQLMKIGAA